MTIQRSTSPSGASPAQPLSDTIIGRDRELAAVDEFLAGSATDATLVLVGPAGVGKTRLVEEAARRAEAKAMWVLSIDSLVGDSLLPAPERHIEVLETLERVANDQHVLVVAEDVHRAGDLALSVLVELAEVRTLALHLLLTARPEPWSASAAQALELHIQRGRDLRVRELSPRAAVTLAQARLGHEVRPALAGYLGQAQGNPLYLLQLLDNLMASGGIDVSSTGLADLVEDPRHSMSLEDAIVAATETLSEASRDVLRIGAALGSSFSLARLASVLGTDPLTALDRLRPLVTASLLETTDHGVSFRHELVHDVVLRSIPGGIRKALHTHIGTVLKDSGVSEDVIARHLVAGADHGDRSVVAWLCEAASEASRRSAELALHLWRHAASLADPSDPNSGVAHLNVVETSIRAARWSDAQQAASAALSVGLDADSEVRVRCAQAYALRMRGRYHEAIAVLDGAVTNPSTPIASARAFALRAYCRAFALDVQGAHRDLRQAEELSGERFDGVARRRPPEIGAVDDPARLFVRAHGHVTRAILNAGAGQVASALKCAAVTTDLVGRLPMVGPLETPHALHGILLTLEDRIDDAIAVVREGARRAEATGDRHQLLELSVYEGLFLVCSGRLDESSTLFETAFRWQHRRPGSGTSIVEAAVALHFALDRNDATEITKWVEAGTAALEKGAALMSEVFLLERARSHAVLRRDDPGVVFRDLLEAWNATTGARHLTSWRNIAAELVSECISQPGDGTRREVAERVTAEVDAIAAFVPAPSAQCVALRCRALLDVDAESARAALRAGRESAYRLLFPMTCFDAATVLAKTGNRAEALAAVVEGSKAAVEMAATFELRRLETLGRSLGGPPLRRRPRPVNGWESLTPTERLVVTHVAGGATNRRIGEQLGVSRRTVETHLRHVFDKLGVQTRTELAAAAMRHGDDPPIAT